MNQSSQKEPEKSGHNKSISSQIIEPASILTLSVAAVYLIGWSIMGGLFHRIGIPLNSLQLPPTYYLEHGAGTMITVWLVVSCVIIASVSSTIFSYIIRSLPLLFIIVWCLVLFQTSSNRAAHILWSGIIAGTVIGLPVLLIPRKVLLKLVQRSFMERMILAFFLYTVLIFLGRFNGNFVGSAIVEGRSYSSVLVTFEWKELPPSGVEGKELILVIFNDHKYYVVEREFPAPLNPKVWIIPDESVKYAKLEQIPH